MKLHQPSRLRLLVVPVLISAAALAGTLAFATASSASSHRPASSAGLLRGAISGKMLHQGLEISRPARMVPHVSERAALAVARAQPFARFSGVQQAVLAHVTFYRMSPKESGLFWVLSLKPSGNVPSNGVPGSNARPVKATYEVIVINAATGHFYWAAIGG